MNILRAEAVLAQIAPQSTRLSDIYDDDDMVREAVNTLIPGFEYPDHSHKTIRELLVKYHVNPLPLLATPA